MERVKKLPTKINVGGVMYYHYITVGTKGEAEDHARVAERRGRRAKLRQFSSMGKVRPTKVWAVYTTKGN